MCPKSIKSFTAFQTELENNVELQNQFKADPINAVKQFSEQNPLSTDKWIYRIIVIGLSGTVLFIIIGVIILMMADKITNDSGVPTILTAIGSAAIGALAGLLAPAPRDK